MRVAIWLCLFVLILPLRAAAFCGFYVAGADATLFNDATQVVLMRSGKRTVLSMQNNYRGPAENFAMVVPVPVVLRENDVKTLPASVFTRVDQLAAPRLVEYWEEDPCAPPIMYERMAMAARASADLGGGVARSKSLGVKIEAQFTVGEYEIVILSAKDSSGLDTWLRQEGYRIPEGAEPLLRPYVQGGMKFFVAKVNAKKVTFDEEGQAVLSPLRFHYDSDGFSLPVRLGMVNSAGTQDLIVHILSTDRRYEVANYKNATIPTNLDVRDDVRGHFGEFYTSLFDATLREHPQAVITEYAWDAGGCDPCPTPPLTPDELATLGADVLPAGAQKAPWRQPFPAMSGMVLTRLHARYAKGSIEEDLRFVEATPIAGGREFVSTQGALEQGSVPSTINNFQARYAIRHPWKGPIKCDNPIRGRWGGPPGGAQPAPQPASQLARAQRGDKPLTEWVVSSIPGLSPASLKSPSAKSPSAPVPDASVRDDQVHGASQGGPVERAIDSTSNAEPASSSCQLGRGGGAWGVLAALLAALGLYRRRPCAARGQQGEER